MKLGRRGKLSVEVAPDAAGVPTANVTIPENLTVEFEITRQFLASSQTATFRVYNLAEGTRNQLQKDPYALTEFRAIQFRAGYADFPLPLVFNGFVRSATSKQSGPNVVTEIEAYDGGLAMATGFSSMTFAAGTGQSQVLSTLARALPRLAGAPVVGDFSATNLRGKVLFGNTWNVLVEESGGLAFIDNGQVKILQPNEALEAAIPLIDAETGLLGAPRRTPTMVQLDLLFEPRLTVGQIVEVRSRVNAYLNGVYKVTGFTHRGVISPAVAGDAVTSVSLFFGPDELRIVRANLVQ